MDQNRNEERGEILGPVHEGVDGNLSHLVEGVVIHAVDGNSLGDRVGDGGEAGTSVEVGKDLGCEKELKEGLEEVKGRGKYDQENISDDKLLGVDQGTSYNSNHLVNQQVIETVVVIESFETEYVNENNRKLEAKVNESGTSMKVPEGTSETDKNSCVIDIKCSSLKKFSENSEGGQICRICHLPSVQSSDESETTVGPAASSSTSSDLIQLGCACKDELGIAHLHCAEAWFKLKGNRLCEICSETATNVSGVSNYEFLEKWNERRFMENGGNSSRRFGGCCRGQPFCNFLMACLVIAFVLPWFFRVNMF